MALTTSVRIKAIPRGATANAFIAHMLSSLPSTFTNFVGRGVNPPSSIGIV